LKAQITTEVSAGLERVGRISPDNTGAAVTGKYEEFWFLVKRSQLCENNYPCFLKQKLRLKRRKTRLWSRKMRQWCRKVRLWSRKMLSRSFNCSVLLKIFISFQKFCRAFQFFVVVVYCNVLFQSCIWLRLIPFPFPRQSCIWLRLSDVTMFSLAQRKSCVWSRFPHNYLMEFLCFLSVQSFLDELMASGRIRLHKLALGRTMVHHSVRSHFSLPTLHNKKLNIFLFSIFSLRRLHISESGKVTSQQTHGLLFSETRNFLIKPRSHESFKIQLAVTIFKNLVTFIGYDFCELPDMLSLKMNKMSKMNYKLKHSNRFLNYYGSLLWLNMFAHEHFAIKLWSFACSQNGNLGKLKHDYG
jgi:hypothetical protein